MCGIQLPSSTNQTRCTASCAGPMHANGTKNTITKIFFKTLSHTLINGPQFGDAVTCGTCIHACYNDLGLGKGERCFDAIIDNVCPECAMGDLDLGEDGDGRWAMEWEPIVCGGVLSGPIVTTQGSNAYYGKVKFEGEPSAVATMTCEDSQGGQYTGARTSDGFWEMNSGSGAFDCGLDCTLGYGCYYSLGLGTAGPELFGSDGSGC